MKNALIFFSFVLLGFSLLLGMVRFLKGPTVVDRIIALDAVVLCAVGFLALISFVWGNSLYLDLLLVVSLLGFLTTVAFVNYLKEKFPTESEQEQDGNEFLS